MSTSRVVLCILALATIAPAAWATNPAYAKRTRVGQPRGATTMARSDVGRSGLTPDPLPRALAVRRELRVTGGITTGMLSDAEGRLVIATLDPELVQLARDGKQLWSASTGKSPAVVQPVLASDGTRVVLNAENQLFGFGSSGKRRFLLQLPAGYSPSADLLPMPDGSVIVALSTRLLRVSADGRLLDTARTHSKVVALLGKDRDVLALTNAGDLLRWRSPHPPRRIAGLGGPPTGGVVRGRHLLTIVGGSRLLDIDLPTLTQHVRWSLQASSALASPVALPDGNTLTWTSDGLLLRHDRAGAEAMRVSLEPGTTTPSPVSNSPVLADASGRFAFARAGLGLGIVDPDGSLHFVEGASCEAPVSLIAVGNGGYALGCRSGVLWLLEGKAP
ncbi:MAG: hypothetical protein R3B89_02520 [Polyangiaceae bacterium]